MYGYKSNTPKPNYHFLNENMKCMLDDFQVLGRIEWSSTFAPTILVVPSSSDPSRPDPLNGDGITSILPTHKLSLFTY